MEDGQREADRLTYGELDRRARALAGGLAELGAAKERALLLYPPGLEFIVAFLGCLHAGVVAVPSYPPRPRRDQARLASIVDDCEPGLVLGHRDAVSRRDELVEEIPALAAARWIETEAMIASVEAEEPSELPPVDAADLAFLQYTSGSTSTPKGVMVTHGNLVHNESLIARAFDQDESSVILSWLPLYHDMGLIGGVLQPLFLGATCVLMSPMSFLQRPARWVEAISRYRATTSGGPNFAYDLVSRRIDPETVAALDLSCWKVAFNGSEPIQAATLERFAKTLAPAGFRRAAFLPCYGLAEATLFVSGSTAGPNVEAFDPASLGEDAAVPGSAEGRLLVGSGRVWPEQRVRIVDPRTRIPCAADRVGEIWIEGPSVAKGYWNRPELTERDFAAVPSDEEGSRISYLRTGDLGFLHEGEIYVTGRLKDLIILRGRNLYPQDIELTAEQSHPALRPGGGAAFSVDSDEGERLVVVHELKRRSQRQPPVEEIAAELRRAVLEEHEAAVRDVVLIRTATLPKTSSGKVQRRACRAAYLAGKLAVVAHHRLESEAGSDPIDVESSEEILEALTQGPLDERRHRAEEALRERVATLLGLDPSRIGREDRLAALGLDSLSAVQLAADLESRFGEAPALSSLSAHRLEELASELVERLAGAAPSSPGPVASPAATLAATPAMTERPLTWGQREIWLAQRLEPASPVYNLALALRLEGALDVPLLEKAVTRLVSLHDALRTTFHDTPSGPIQRFAATSRAAFSRVDASAWSAERRAAAREEIAWRPFDLENGPLLRVGVLSRGEELHEIVFAAHHLVCDLWSLALLLRDLGELYAGREPGPAPSYAVHVEKRRLWLASPAGQRLEKLWLERFNAPPEPLRLPVDRQAPALPSYRGAALPLALADLAPRLHALAERRGARLYTVLLAAWASWLLRVTGRERFAIGSPLAGRAHADLTETVGYLVHLLPLQVETRGEAAFIDLVESLESTVRWAWDHQDFPQGRLAELLTGAGKERASLFETVFALQKAPSFAPDALSALASGEPGRKLRLGPLELESIALPARATAFDLAFLVHDSEPGLSSRLEYSSELFDRSSALRFVDQLRRILEAVADDPTASLASLPLLSYAELEQCLVEWSGGGAAWSEDASPVPARVAVHAAERPTALAVVTAEARLTYEQLGDRAGRVARWLTERGAGPESVVAVWMERTAEQIVALLGTLESGAAYLPIDPDCPPERAAWMIEDAGARFLLAPAKLGSTVSDGSCHATTVEEILDSSSSEAPVKRAGRDASCDGLAYVIYTSGSTGRPKGVAVDHRSLARLVDWHAASYGVGPGWRASQLAGPAFDASVWEIWPTLASGASLHLGPEDVRVDATRLGDWLAEEQVHVAFLPTPLLEEYLRQPGAGRDPLRFVLTGGDRLRSRRPAGFDARLVNHYGPTESTVVTTAGEVAKVEEAEERRSLPSIGRPIAGRRIHVLDPWGGPVGPGIAGELWIGGVGLARGYVGRPGSTADHFRPAPRFENGELEPGSRLYRSGDRVRFGTRGDLEFLGRVDHQVKVRGFRIEPGEIEAVLCEHPRVLEAVVAPRGDGARARLCAWVETTAEVAELREHLARRLPPHMVPSAMARLERLPRNTSGKIDRRALPEPRVGGEAPRGETEEALATIWRELLEVEEVFADSDFFELGGHSLLATRLASRLREERGREISLATVFERSVLRDMAREIDAGASSEPLDVLAPADREAPLPLSFAQERLWILDRLAPGSAVYNIPVALTFVGRLRVDALILALGRVVARHESLRTRFEATSTGVAQVIAAPATTAEAPPRVDLAGLDAPARRRQELRLAAEQARRPFDLETGPLWRAALLKLAEDHHTLLVTLHHAVADGGSMEILAGELESHYEAIVNGVAKPLAPLFPQYADHAAHQRRRWAEGGFAEGLEYWREQLTGVPRTLELPTDRPRPAVLGDAGSRIRVRIEPARVRALEALARRRGASLFMVLQAAFATLLGRYAGQDEWLLGAPVTERTRRDLEPLIGVFVNTVALRVDSSGDPSFEEFLGRVRETSLVAFEHKEVPFEKVVEALSLERRRDRAPLFQVMLALQDRPRRLELPDLEVEAWEPPRRTAHFEITLALGRDGDQLEGELEYHAELFDAATAERWRDSLLRLLEAVVSSPEERLSRLPLLGAEERERILKMGSSVSPELPAGLLPEWLAEQARERGDALAVMAAGDDESLSYRQLEERSTRLARRLVARGVASEDLVGLLLERSPQWLVAQLATWKAGAAWMPLDPKQPVARLESLVSRFAPACLLAGPEHGPLAKRLANGVPVLDPAEEEGVAAAMAARLGLPGPAHDESLAYVIHTSGSTGEPKGVAVSHRALARHAFTVREKWALSADDRVLHFSSPTFDMAIDQVHPVLLAGATVVLADRELKDAASLLELATSQGWSVVDLPTRLFHQFARAGAEARSTPPTLRLAISGGEQMAASTAELWRRSFAGESRLLNAYGPTEAVVTATVHEIDVAEPRVVGATVPIGRPFGGRSAHVVEVGGTTIAALGAVGELWLGGSSLARGYVGEPAKTAAVFVPDPFSTAPGERLYRTGDRARRRPDGALEFSGRLDRQLKVRGFRIEAGEVEAALAADDDVRQVIVHAHGERLVAWVVAGSSAEPAEPAEAFGELETRLREIAERRLPAHMRPMAYVFLEKIPTTRHGKVDLAALPAPVTPEEASTAPPRTPLESLLAEIWADVLDLEAVSVESEFFALGGHSLLATRVSSRVREALGVELPVSRLFEGATVRRLAGEIEGLRRRAVPPLRRRPEADAEAPLSPAQERLWFLHRLEPDSPAYNMAGTSRFAVPVEAAALEAALVALTERHEALRTIFVETAEGPRQRIVSSWRFALPVVDLDALPEARRQAEARRVGRREAQRPFDLGRLPLARFVLLRLGLPEAPSMTLINLHHVVADGWSLREILPREIAALYRAALDGSPSSLAPLALQYADYAVWQRLDAFEERVAEDVEILVERLQGAPETLALPTDRPRSRVTSSRGLQVSMALGEELSTAVDAWSRRRSTTPFMTLLAAFGALLARLSRQQDLLVGFPVAGRERPELEGLIGLFVNTLVLRLEPRGSFADFTSRVRGEVLSVHDRREVPLEKLIEASRPSRDATAAPLFQVMLTVLEERLGSTEPTGFAATPELLDTGAAKFDLDLSLARQDGGYVGHWEAAADLFDRTTVIRFARSFARLLEAATADPELAVTELPLLSAAESHQLREEWNDTKRLDDSSPPLLERLEALALADPTALAVVAPGESLDRAELGALATTIAGRLEASGVGPESVVAVFLERSARQVAAILGVLETGAAYLPIDPGYPPARTAFMLEDSGAERVLTSRDLASRLPRAAVDAALFLDDIDDGKAAAGRDDSRRGRSRRFHPERLAYVIYTSGSTGRPKGVGVSHRGLASLIAWHLGEHELEEGQRASQLAGPGFDAAVWETWPTLAAGASLHLPDEETRLDAARLTHWLRDERIDLAFLPTPLVEACFDVAEAGRRPPRRILTGGDRLRHRPPAEWSSELVNHYGPTEATVVTSAGRVAPAPEPTGAALVPPTIGRPIDNLRARVLDRSGRLVPAGAVGELWIGGEALARGYLGRPGLTAERFRPDPWSAHGERLYRTGDLARWRVSGELDFRGREDHQVQIRGFRVELGEIEAAVLSHEAAREAVVVARPSAGGASFLVGYVVGDALDTAELAKHLRSRLPEHMIPSAWITLEALPKTSHGKIDRAALPSPATPSAERVAPRTPEEKRLAELWSAVLEIEEPGVEDDFFALGGHSLKATQLLTKVRESFGFEYPLREFFEAPRIAAMARRLEATRATVPASQEHAGAAPPPLAPRIRRRRRGSGDLQQLLEKARGEKAPARAITTPEREP